MERSVLVAIGSFALGIVTAILVVFPSYGAPRGDELRYAALPPSGTAATVALLDDRDGTPVPAALPATGSGSTSSGEGFVTAVLRRTGGRESEQRLLIRSQADVRELFPTVDPLPSFDFENGMFVAAYGGTHPTSGYVTEIVEVRRRGDALTVFVRETAPGEGCDVEPTTTAPYHVVRVPVNTPNVLFVTERQVREC